MFKLFLIAAFVATTAFASSIDFELCPTPDGTAGTLPGPISFAIPECLNGSPCDVAIGQTVTLLIGVYVPEAVTAMPVQATVSVGGASFDFPLPHGDACFAIATGCPQTAGNYLIEFPTTLQGVDPGTEATVQVKINNQAGRVLACGIVTTTFN